jgi:hypothetical protein
VLILLVGLAFVVLSFSSFALAFQINGINRVVVATPITIFETSTLNDLDNDEPLLQFSKELVNERLNKFYSFELSKFTSNFNYEIYFYNQWNGSMCVDDECDAVEIAFSATLLYGYQYHRTINFEVFKN